MPAKRFLCATDPSYLGQLSEASVLSLKLQGGPFTPEEAAEFRENPHAEAAVALRRLRRAGQDPGTAHARPRALPPLSGGSPCRATKTKIRLVIFDWAGTTIDHGSLAPADAVRPDVSRHGAWTSRRTRPAARWDCTRRITSGPCCKCRRWRSAGVSGMERAATEADIDGLY